MTYESMIAEMKAAGFVVEHYPGMGKAFATSDNNFFEAKNIKQLYSKFKNTRTWKN